MIFHPECHGFNRSAFVMVIKGYNRQKYIGNMQKNIGNIQKIYLFSSVGSVCPVHFRKDTYLLNNAEMSFSVIGDYKKLWNCTMTYFLYAFSIAPLSLTPPPLPQSSVILRSKPSFTTE
jgi:hypothetical protein